MNQASYPYPWQAKPWEQLQSRRKQGNLPHALLLSGAKGLGKFEFARAFAQSLLCAKSGCGECHACKLFAADTHPDFKVVLAENETTKNNVIKIDKIRDTQSWLHQSCFGSQGKIVLINPAEAMNKSAANALLKNLEEPCNNTYLVLISDRPSLLPATIRSRCQTLVFSTSAYKCDKIHFLKQTAMNFDHDLLLALSDNAPLLSLELIQSDHLQQRQQVLSGLFYLVTEEQDPIDLAAQCNKVDLLDILTWMTTYLLDVIKANLHIENIYWLNQDYISQIAKVAERISLLSTYEILDRIYQLRHQRLIGIHLNQPLLLESLFFQWIRGTLHGKS